MGTAFRYTALDPEGARVSGVVQARTREDAVARLSASGLVPTSVRARAGTPARWRARAGAKEAAAFTRELSVLLQAHIPIAQGLASIASSERNPVMSEMISHVAAAIEAGMPLSEAIQTHGVCFDDAYVESIRAAEQSGTLEQVSEHLADLLESSVAASQRMRRALMYPITVLTAAAIAMAVITIFVVPRFAVIFESNGVELPLATRMITAAGESIRAWWPMYAGSFAVAAFSAGVFLRSERGARSVRRGLMFVPVLGRLVVASSTARFSRLLGISISAGLDVVQAIEIAGKSTGDPILAADCSRVADRLRVGDQLSDALRSSSYMPALATRLLGAGKEASEISRSSNVVGRHYEREANYLAASVGGLIEPLMTVLLAAIVLVLALSVFLPMWQLMQVGGG